MVVHLCQASSQAAAAVVSAAPATVDSLLHLISSRRVLCTSFEGGAEALAALCAAGGPAAAAVLARPAAVATMAAALERLPREITTLRPSNPNPFSGRVAGIVEHFLKAFYALLGLENWADLLLCQPGTATAFRAPGTPAALARAFAPLVGRLQDMPDQCVAALNVLGVIPGLREPGGVLPPNGGNVELEIFSNAQLRAELPALLLGVGGAGGGGPWDESLEREMASPGLVAQGRSVRLLTVCLRDATVWADAMRDAALCRSAARALAAQGSSALRGLQPGGGGVGDMVRMLRLQTVAMLVEVFHFLVPHDPPQGGDASGPVPTAAYEALQADGGAGRRALLLVSQRLVPCSAVGMDAETAAWTVEHADSVLRRLRRLQAACDATAAATAAPAAAAAGASGSSSSSGGGAAAPAAAASSSGGVRTTQVKACLTCGKASGEGGVKLRACAGCGVAFFCNLECQKEGWRGHKRACRAAQAAKAAAEAQ